MAKFLNKKEQVIDFKLTPYGKYLLATNRLKPTYYAFYDDNIIYDSAYAKAACGVGCAPYATSSVTTIESQNNIQYRIQEETPYLESMVVYENVEENIDLEGSLFHNITLTTTQEMMHLSNLKLTEPIGDAYAASQQDQAPALKIISLQNDISSSTSTDVEFKNFIPQIDITSVYTKKVMKDDPFPYALNEPENIVATTGRFADGRVIKLIANHPLIYAEEIHTELLTENFEVEIFEIISGSDGERSRFKRKLFNKKQPQIIDGFLISATPAALKSPTVTTASVNYYFDCFIDGEISPEVACRAAEEFNKESYYIDLDFNCEEPPDRPPLYYDIYEKVTEPEPCLD